MNIRNMKLQNEMIMITNVMIAVKKFHHAGYCKS